MILIMSKKQLYEAPEAEAFGLLTEVRFLTDSDPQIKPGEEEYGGDY